MKQNKAHLVKICLLVRRFFFKICEATRDAKGSYLSTTKRSVPSYLTIKRALKTLNKTSHCIIWYHKRGQVLPVVDLAISKKERGRVFASQVFASPTSAAEIFSCLFVFLKRETHEIEIENWERRFLSKYGPHEWPGSAHVSLSFSSFLGIFSTIYPSLLHQDPRGQLV